MTESPEIMRARLQKSIASLNAEIRDLQDFVREHPTLATDVTPEMTQALQHLVDAASHLLFEEQIPSRETVKTAEVLQQIEEAHSSLSALTEKLKRQQHTSTTAVEVKGVLRRIQDYLSALIP